jgi:tRNA-dihydrouridine synthase
MKNISCWAFRALFPEATDSYTEMLNLKELVTLKRRVWDNVDTFSINNQHQWVQVLTNNINDISHLPACLEKFCRDNPERANIYGVNINACCPDPRVISAGEGAALIKRTKRLRDLIMAFLGEPNSHPFNINCKILLGLNSKEMYYHKFLDFLNAIQSINDARLKPSIIHFKHAKQSSKSKPHWELLETALIADMPIIINGNIYTNQDVQKIIKKLPLKSQKKCSTLISGIMIGRAAIKNLNCFQTFISSPNKSEISKKTLLVDNLNKHRPHGRFYKNFKDFYPYILKN